MLARTFKNSKEKIIKAVKEGIKTFQIGKWTCLSSDWSKLGMGFALLQKACKCEDLTPKCCKDGWQITYAGSRFTTSAESRYHPVEGEALSAAWALHKTRHFTLGCQKLILAVDHKPLLKILGDRAPCAENDKINELDEPYFGTHILSDSLPSQTFEIPKKNTQPLISTRGLGCSGHQKSESFKTEL